MTDLQRLLFEDKARGLSAGIWEQGANESRWMDYPVNEFMTVLEGEVVIVEEDRSVSIKAGESFIIPKGLRCRWTQKGPVKKFFVIFDDANIDEAVEWIMFGIFWNQGQVCSATSRVLVQDKIYLKLLDYLKFLN